MTHNYVCNTSTSNGDSRQNAQSFKMGLPHHDLKIMRLGGS